LSQRRLPTSMQTIGGRNCQDTDVAAEARQHSRGRDSFTRDRSLISDNELAIRARRTHPVSPRDNPIAKPGVHIPPRLFQGSRREAQIDGASDLVLTPLLSTRIGLTASLQVIECPV